jgi:hypothetical protein
VHPARADLRFRRQVISEQSHLNRPDHPDHPPDIPALLSALNEHRVRCVLAGSVAARAYGADVTPGDLDVVPALDRENLERLAELLLSIEAAIDGRVGVWTAQPGGGMRWIETPESPEQHAARAAAWAPDPGDVASFDHLFRTRHGHFDTPPMICGTFDAMNPRALSARIAGHPARVAHVDDLLARFTLARRAKDMPRIEALRAARREGRAPSD